MSASYSNNRVTDFSYMTHHVLRITLYNLIFNFSKKMIDSLIKQGTIMTKNHKMNELAVRIGMNYIIKYKYCWLLICLALVVTGYWGLNKLTMDSSNDTFFAADDETMIDNQKFKDLFGNEEFVFVFIEANEIFTSRTLQKIRDLTEDLEKNIPFAKEVISITNVEFIDSYNDVLEIHDLIPDEIPQNTEELQRIRDKVMTKKVYVDKLITRDGKKTGIIISFERLPQ